MSPRTPRQPYPQDHGSHIPILIGLGLKIRIRRVLELGAGRYSTSLFLNRSVFPDIIELASVETEPEWIARTLAEHPDQRITITPSEPADRSRFDLIFVDSPHAPMRVAVLRELAAIKDLPAIVVIHDSEFPLYREEFDKFAHQFDFDNYEPSTAILWNERANTPELLAAIPSISGTITRYQDTSPVDVDAWLARFRDPDNPVSYRLTVSVAMCAYHRHEQMRNTFESYLIQTRKPDQIVMVEDGYDGGLTEAVCKQYADRLPIEYVCRRNRPDVAFSNASVPRNIGIRKCTGEIIVIQNAEVRFTKPTDFENIIAPMESDPMIACCAPCKALNEDGSFKGWYCDPNMDNFNHFCMAFRKAHIMAIGGFDENYRAYGYEDGDFHYRFNRLGVRTIYAKDTITEHQWHYIKADPNVLDNEKFNIEYGVKMVEDIMAGRRTIEANVGKDWGNIDS